MNIAALGEAIAAGFACFGIGFVTGVYIIALDTKRRRKTYQESADNEAPKTLGLRR